MGSRLAVGTQVMETTKIPSRRPGRPNTRGGNMAQALEGISIDKRLGLEVWHDPVVDALGHDPRSRYVERFWLPVLGPSTTLLLRLLVTHLEVAPSGCTIDASETSRALGLGERAGRHGPFLRTVARALDFNAVRICAPGILGVRRYLPGLSARHLARLPETLRREHSELVNGSGASAESMRRRAQQLALSLLEIGEDSGATERQLVAWRFPSSTAKEGVAWAERELRTARHRASSHHQNRMVVDGHRSDLAIRAAAAHDGR